MYYECVHDFECDNQTITRFNPRDISLDVLQTEDRGYGVETSGDIVKGQAIVEFIGKVVLKANVSFCSLILTFLLIALERIYHSSPKPDQEGKSLY
jgi:hypothetical protein